MTVSLHLYRAFFLLVQVEITVLPNFTQFLHARFFVFAQIMHIA